VNKAQILDAKGNVPTPLTGHEKKWREKVESGEVQKRYDALEKRRALSLDDKIALSMDRSRCDDTSCPSWNTGCARAEMRIGQNRFIWLDRRRQHGASSCPLQIDPDTLEEAGS
jgi:hypothetical protein